MKHWRVNILPAIPFLTAGLFLAPVILGLFGTWLPAFGWFPAIGHSNLSLQPWLHFTSHPSFNTAFIHTLVTGLGAATLVIVFTAILLIGAYPSKLFSWIEKTLAPILSVPHAAFAIGLGFLLTPSGWLIRLVIQTTGLLEQPPSWSAFQDPAGFSLILTLVLKETPFLLFMCLAVLPTLNTKKTIWLAKSVGHSTRYAWTWLLFPQLYKQIKLPFFAIIAYSLTVVDIALIAGPTTPPTIAVLITQLFNDPDLNQRMTGSAGASGLLILIISVLLLLHGLEKSLSLVRHFVLTRGQSKTKAFNWEPIIAPILSVIFLFTYILAFVITLLWSFSFHWRFPNIFPEQFSFRSWARVFDRMIDPLWCTFLLAGLSAFIAIVLVILALENEVRLKYKSKKINTDKILLLIYVPLLVPQIAFLFGFQVWLIQMGFDGFFAALLWSHLVFVVPYVFLTLSGPYRKFDDRYSWLALSLSGGRQKNYWRVKFPMLLRPILYAVATGFSVSVAQYLPTLFIGAGKFSTITTEAVAMSSGSDRRMMAVLALWQQFLPLIIFLMATLIPAFRFRNRPTMSHNAS